MLADVDAPSIAETLPETYRRVLDRIADLDVAGYRREADLVRRDAIRAYARRWNGHTATQLDRLAERAERVLGGRDRARSRHRTRRGAVLAWLALAPRLVGRRIRGGLTLERPAA